MCTAISYNGRYFGRTLDYEHSFGEQIVITPRNYGLFCRGKQRVAQHYAMIGMAKVVNDYPLYFDAVNERGLGIAGLNFVGNAKYFAPVNGMENIPPYEFIPWVLGQCASMDEVTEMLSGINLTNLPFSDEIPLASLHWMITDGKDSIVVESVADGLKLYDNPIGVLTNNPPFPIQLFNLNNYMHLSRSSPKNSFLPGKRLECYSRGMGAIGMPGDNSSMSRFVRAAFVKSGPYSEQDGKDGVVQFFHILRAVEQQRGCTALESGEYEITRYTSCCDLEDKIYYYNTYDNFGITGIALHNKVDEDALRCYPLRDKMVINYEK